MSRFRRSILTTVALAAFLGSALPVLAGHGGGGRGCGYGGYRHGGYGHGGFYPGFGVSFGFGYGYGGYYGTYGYGGYPLSIAVPPTVVVGSSPVIVQPPPVFQAPPVAAQPEPGPSALSALPVPRPLDELPDADQDLRRLSDPSERVRADAVMSLGRNMVQRAVLPLTRVLGNDRSAEVREAAARALGLIGSPQSLNALQNAAQTDADHDVRHSAQFAAEVIRSNLRGR
jgi:hypothetical protein